MGLPFQRPTFYQGLSTLCHFLLLFLALFVPSSPGQRQAESFNYYGKQIEVFKLLGQSKVGDAGRNKVTGRGLYHAAGVLVDNSDFVSNLYVVDTGNNRVLGYRMAGALWNSQLTGRKGADIAIGQPDFGSATCNGDSNLGFTKAPTRSSLCLFGYPMANNTAEGWMRISIDVDTEGNLYVPDYFNNRILKYNQPFSPNLTDGKGDSVADFVWGQQTFETNLRNGSPHYVFPSPPSANSIWINYGILSGFDHVTSRGVSVDSGGNVWVADTFNSRILRFRQNNKDSDLVIGQPNFSSRLQNCQETVQLNRLCTPTLARIHPETGDLYVLDEYPAPFRARFLVFRPPFSNGMNAYRTFTPIQNGPFQNWGAWDGQGTYRFQATGFVFNKYRVGEYANGEIWVNEHQSSRTLLIDLNGNIVKVIGAATPYLIGGDQNYFGCPGLIYDGNRLWWPGGSIGMDRRNNIYLADEFFHTVYRYSLPYETFNYNGRQCLPDANGAVFPKGPNEISDERLGESVGLAVYGDQLVVRDERQRLKIYNQYQAKDFGAAPDLVLRGGLSGRNRLSGSVDSQNRLWLSGEHQQIRVFQLPFKSNQDIPVADFLKLYWKDTGEEIVEPRVDNVAFDPVGRAMYLTDFRGARIFRVRNFTNLARLEVDMVIGQVDKNNVQCNRGNPNPSATSLCGVSQIKFDRLGNLYVVENNYECSGNRRIVMFRKEDLNNANTMFPNIAASKVFNSPNMTQLGDCAYGVVNRPGSPVMIAFNSKNEMVIGNDGYYGDLSQRSLKQLWLYRDPINRQIPDASIDLYMGTPGEIDFDSNDNLLIQDHTWYRVMMINLDADPEWLIPVQQNRERYTSVRGFIGTPDNNGKVIHAGTLTSSARVP